MYSKLSGFQLNIAKPITKDTNNPYGPIKTQKKIHSMSTCRWYTLGATLLRKGLGWIPIILLSGAYERHYF